MIPNGTAVRYVGDILRWHGVEGNVRCRVVKPEEDPPQDYYVVNLPGTPRGVIHALEGEIFPVTELNGNLERMSGIPSFDVLHRDHDAMVSAKARGYTSEICTTCQNMTMTRNGPCLKCETCGTTSGCG